MFFLCRIFAAKSKFWYMKKNNNTPSLSREGRGGSHKASWQETYATPEEIKVMLGSLKDGSAVKKLQAEVTELKTLIAEQKKVIREQKREIKDLKKELNYV